MKNKNLMALFLVATLTTTVILHNEYKQNHKRLYHEVEQINIKTPKELLNEFMQRSEELKREQMIKEIVKSLAEQIRNSKPRFNPSDVTEGSNLTLDQIHYLLQGTALDDLSPYYYEFEKKYGLNAFFIMSLTAEESGWGTSYLATNYNNIAGHKNKYGGWKYYDSKVQCLEETFRLISQEYVSPKGDFYCGKDMFDINLTYCPNKDNPTKWANNIYNISQELLQKLKEENNNENS